MEAYLISVNDDEDSGAIIVFAGTENEARNIGAAELLTDSESVEAVRNPEYDRYSDLGYVPIKVLYDDNWWFECWHCQVKVYDDCENEDEEGNFLEPVFERQRLFCSEACRHDFYVRVNANRQERDAVKQHLFVRLPGIAIASCHGGGEHGVWVEFSFPGGKYGVRWNSKDPDTFLVTVGDKENWAAFCASLN
jgi:hypothetical protein